MSLGSKLRRGFGQSRLSVDPKDEGTFVSPFLMMVDLSSILLKIKRLRKFT